MARLSLEPSRDPAAYSFSHRLRARFAETDGLEGCIHAREECELDEAEHQILLDRDAQAAIARFTPFTMVEIGLPSFSNCSAQ